MSSKISNRSGKTQPNESASQAPTSVKTHGWKLYPHWVLENALGVYAGKFSESQNTRYKKNYSKSNFMKRRASKSIIPLPVGEQRLK